MKSTPPIARLMVSFVLGAVCPTYCPTRSSRVATTRWPLRTYPSWWRMRAIRSATVVFPVPGRPVKLMCSVGRSVTSPRCSRTRATSNNAAISLMRVLMGRRPTSSCSSSSNTGAIGASRRRPLRRRARPPGAWCLRVTRSSASPRDPLPAGWRDDWCCSNPHQSRAVLVPALTPAFPMMSPAFTGERPAHGSGGRSGRGRRTRRGATSRRGVQPALGWEGRLKFLFRFRIPIPIPIPTAANIRESATLFRTGFAADLVQATFFLLTAMALYLLLRHVNELVARAMVVFVAVSVAIICLNLLNQFTALQIATGSVFGGAESDALTGLFAGMHHDGYLIAQIFFGLWGCRPGCLAWTTGGVPPALGLLLIVGCFGYLADTFARFLAPGVADAIEPFLVPAAIGELSFVVWLLVKGVPTGAPRVAQPALAA